MRVTILALGTQGDVLPYLALGLGLQSAGHRVRIATHSNFQALVTQRGLRFHQIATNPQELLSSHSGKVLLGTGRNFVRFARSFIEAIQPLAEKILEDLWTATDDTDVLLYSALGVAAYPLARERGILAQGAFLQPITRTREWPAVWVPARLPLGRTGNWLTHVLTEQAFWQVTRPFINRWRRGQGLARGPLWGYYGEIYPRPEGWLYGFSPSIVPKPADWGDGAHVTGYWFLERPADWKPAAELVDFLDSGPPPVYIGFGSMQSFDIEARLSAALKALRRTRQRGILSTGWSGVSRSDLPDNVLKVDWVPHDWLFPRMALAIHHGGAGTTAAALRAGIPSIIMPFFFDQYFWAQRLADLGLGSRLPARGGGDPAAVLAAAIEAALRDQGMRQRSRAFSQVLRQEDGVTQAVRAFEAAVNAGGHR